MYFTDVYQMKLHIENVPTMYQSQGILDFLGKKWISDGGFKKMVIIIHNFTLWNYKGLWTITDPVCQEIYLMSDELKNWAHCKKMHISLLITL